MFSNSLLLLKLKKYCYLCINRRSLTMRFLKIFDKKFLSCYPCIIKIYYFYLCYQSYKFFPFVHSVSWEISFYSFLDFFLDFTYSTQNLSVCSFVVSFVLFQLSRDRLTWRLFSCHVPHLSIFTLIMPLTLLSVFKILIFCYTT